MDSMQEDPPGAKLRGAGEAFLGELWVNERGQRRLRPLTPRRSWLQGPAITEIDSPRFRGGCRPIAEPPLIAEIR